MSAAASQNQNVNHHATVDSGFESLTAEERIAIKVLNQRIWGSFVVAMLLSIVTVAITIFAH